MQYKIFTVKQWSNFYFGNVLLFILREPWCLSWLLKRTQHVCPVVVSHSCSSCCVPSMHLLFRWAGSSSCLLPSTWLWLHWCWLQGGRAMTFLSAEPRAGRGGGELLQPGPAGAGSTCTGADGSKRRGNWDPLQPVTSSGFSPSSHMGLNLPLSESKQWDPVAFPPRIFFSVVSGILTC